MWDYIKRAINSDLTKPLDTLITEKFSAMANPVAVIKSVQRGQYAIAASTPTATITISSVVLNKSFVTVSSSSQWWGDTYQGAPGGAYLSNSTTLSIALSTSRSGVLLFWEVVEYV